MGLTKEKTTDPVDRSETEMMRYNSQIRRHKKQISLSEIPDSNKRVL